MHCGDDASGLRFLFARYTLHTSIHPHPFFTLISSLHFLKQQNELLFKGTSMLSSSSLPSAEQIIFPKNEKDEYSELPSRFFHRANEKVVYSELPR